MESNLKWETNVDEWAFSDVLGQVEDLRREDFDSTFTECLYGTQATILQKLAAICGSNKPTNIAEILSKPEPMGKAKLFPGLEAKVGTPARANIVVNGKNGQRCSSWLDWLGY